MEQEYNTKRYSDVTEDLVSFVPLRKKIKKIGTGEEWNCMESYYKPTTQIESSQSQHIRIRNGIHVEGSDVPAPISYFSDLNLPNAMQSQLHALGYKSPTPVQMQTIPCAMSGRDVIGLSETGSGKTLAYVIPLLGFLKDKKPTQPGQGPIAMILAPTRELVEQIHSEVEKFINPEKNPYLYLSASQRANSAIVQGTYPIMRSLGVVGGIASSTQVQPIQRSGVDIIIATPGRLIDLLDRNIVTMDRLSYLVFDEADRMLTMNMEEQLRKIIGYANICPRQTLMFSATMPISVQRLARTAVLNPIIITVSDSSNDRGTELGVAKSVTQDIRFMHTYQKKIRLLETLRSIPRPPVIIFCNSHYTVDKLVDLLRNEQFHVAGIHSNKNQGYRFRAMKALKDGEADILVASDLVSRGIDVPDVQHVIMYDMPDTFDDYIHRCGRTGRYGREGVCIAFLTYECKIAKDLKKMLKESKQPIPKELEDTKSFGECIKTEFGDIPKTKTKT